MEIGSDCRGSCDTCRTHFIGGCLAGHGDDHYSKVSAQWIEGFNVGNENRPYDSTASDEWKKGFESGGLKTMFMDRLNRG